MLIKGVFALLVMLFLFSVFNSVLRSVGASVQRFVQTSVRAPQSKIVSSVRSVNAISTANPCHEVIDKRSGTYIDHCAPEVPSKPPSKEDVRASQREADDAMKVLAPNTPEM